MTTRTPRDASGDDGRSRSVSRLVSRFEQLDRGPQERPPTPARSRNLSVEARGRQQEKLRAPIDSSTACGMRRREFPQHVTQGASDSTRFHGSGADGKGSIVADVIETNKLRASDKSPARFGLTPLQLRNVPPPLPDTTHDAADDATFAITENIRTSDGKVVALGAFCPSPTGNPSEIILSVVRRGPAVARDSFEIIRHTDRSRHLSPRSGRPPLTIRSPGPLAAQKRISISQLLDCGSPDYNKSLPPTPRTPRMTMARGKKHGKRVKFRSKIASYQPTLVPYVPQRMSDCGSQDEEVELLQAVTYNPYGPPIYEYNHGSLVPNDEGEDGAGDDSGWEDLDQKVGGLATVKEEPSQTSPTDSGISNEKSPVPATVGITPSLKTAALFPFGPYPVVTTTPCRRPPPTTPTRTHFSPTGFQANGGMMSHYLRDKKYRARVRRAYERGVRVKDGKKKMFARNAHPGDTLPEIRKFKRKRKEKEKEKDRPTMRMMQLELDEDKEEKKVVKGIRKAAEKTLSTLAHASVAPLVTVGGVRAPAQRLNPLTVVTQGVPPTRKEATLSSSRSATTPPFNPTGLHRPKPPHSLTRGVSPPQKAATLSPNQSITPPKPATPHHQLAPPSSSKPAVYTPSPTAPITNPFNHPPLPPCDRRLPTTPSPVSFPTPPTLTPQPLISTLYPPLIKTTPSKQQFQITYRPVQDADDPRPATSSEYVQRRPPTPSNMDRLRGKKTGGEVTKYFEELAKKADSILAAQERKRAVIEAVARAAAEEVREKKAWLPCLNTSPSAITTKQQEVTPPPSGGLKRFLSNANLKSGTPKSFGRPTRSEHQRIQINLESSQVIGGSEKFNIVQKLGKWIKGRDEKDITGKHNTGKPVRKEDIKVFNDDREYNQGMAGWSDRGGMGRRFA